MFAITAHFPIQGPVTVGDLTADEAKEARVKLAKSFKSKIVITYQDDPAPVADDEDDASDLRW